jgi:hypothetical protein
MYPTFWHVAAYFASLANGSTNLANTIVSDQVLTPSGTTAFILPKPGKLYAAYSAGVSLTAVRINTPSLRYVGLPFVGPVNLTLTVPSPPNVTVWGEMGPTLPTVDAIAAEHTLGGGAPENELTLLWFKFGGAPVPGGPVYRLRFTATIAGVTGAWASGAITPDSTLPQGTYSVVGMDLVGANIVAGRLIFPGSFFRPGCLARNAAGNVPEEIFTDGSMGVYGSFKSVNLPNLEILVSGANAAQTLFLDLVRTGDFSP